MAAVAGDRLARASAGQLIELVVSAAGLSGFRAGLIDGLVTDDAGVSLLWVCDRICGWTGKSAAIAVPAMAMVPTATVSAAARKGALWQAVIVWIRLWLSWRQLARQQRGRRWGQIAVQRLH